MHDPRWLNDYFTGQGKVYVYFLYQADTICGFAAFLLKNWPIRCQIGEMTLARLPLRRMCLLGGSVHFPEDPVAYELLFRELSAGETGFDSVYLEDVAVDSALWNFVETNPIVRRSFSRYVPDAPSPRVLLRLGGSFEEYLGKFSSKHRQTLKRKVRKFQDVAPSETHMLRFSDPDQVDAFLDQAVKISRRTYQWTLLGEGLRGGENVRRHLGFLAKNGWLRSYLLVGKGEPCAFLVGFQYGPCYYLYDMGYDPGWRDYSVGTVLQMGIIEDLFSYNRPAVYDLGEYGTHKQEFATDHYSQGKIFLFRPGIYTALARAGHCICRETSESASALLEHFGLKMKLKKIIRLWSSRS
jgi:hypothetical protein